MFGKDTGFGGLDPMSQLKELEANIKKAEAYRQSLENTISNMPQASQTPLWEELDNLILSLNDEQKQQLYSSQEYVEVYNQLQALVQGELLNLVKAKIEISDNGKELLKKQLEVAKKLKEAIVSQSNKEAELFKLFKEFSKAHPDATYNDFLKTL